MDWRFRRLCMNFFTFAFPGSLQRPNSTNFEAQLTAGDAKGGELILDRDLVLPEVDTVLREWKEAMASFGPS